MVEKTSKKEKKVIVKEKTKNVEPKKTKTVMASKKTGYAVRGNIFEGIVTSTKSDKTITVKRELTHYVQKYERYKKVFSKIKAHVPEGMIVKEGDKVRVGETRKISKTKNFVLIEVTGEKK